MIIMGIGMDLDWTTTGWTVGKGLSTSREWPEQSSPGNRFERGRRRVFEDTSRGVGTAIHKRWRRSASCSGCNQKIDSGREGAG